MLTLVETLYLLYIDEQKGTSAKGIVGPIHYGLSCAILADLTLRNKLAIDGDRIVVVDQVPTDLPILDHVLSQIIESKKTRKINRWIAQIPAADLPKQIAESLVEKNILHVEEKRYLWVIPYETYHQQDASAKYWIKTHLRAVVLAGEKAGEQDIVLLSLLKACDLLNLVFTRDERRSARSRIAELASQTVFGESVKDVLESLYAVMVLSISTTSSFAI
jgi:hypothetical protein